jgi:putative Holliday junction resolvase
LTLEGGEQAASRGARAFAAQLESRYGVSVSFADERATSQEAARRFASRRAAGLAKRKHAEAIDAVAAEVILESWFATHA